MSELIIRTESADCTDAADYDHKRRTRTRSWQCFSIPLLHLCNLRNLWILLREVVMKNYFAAILLVLFSTATYAQDMQMKTSPAEKPATLMTGLGSLHHPTSTTKPEAQRFFDQGLSLVFAFNHNEAVRSFKRAAEIDPQMAMAWWGVALALGPNINADIELSGEQAAVDAAQ